MEKHYRIIGMTCNNCVSKVKEGLLSLPEVLDARVDLEKGKALVIQDKEISLEYLQKAIGKYKITTLKNPPPSIENEEIGEFSIETYKPLFIIISYILGVSILVQYPFQEFSLMLWMRHFMAGFFLVFSFFKILNISGFASSYRMYDIIAKKWNVWGYVYPFIELVLGVLFLIDLMPLYTNITTAIILGVSSIGVIQSNLNHQKIKCACLGDVFNLPMSTITIIEDVTMTLMAIIMIFSY